MFIDYRFKPSLVKKICYIIHKAKTPDFYVHSHMHQYGRYEIIYVDYGNISLVLDKQKFELIPGQTIIIPGGKYHSFYGEAGIPYDYLNIMFEGKIPSKILCKKISFNAKYRNIYEELKMGSMWNAHSCHMELMAAYLTILLGLFLRYDSTPPVYYIGPEPAYQTHYHSEIVNKALKIIEREHYNTSLSLNKVSKAAGVSESYLRFLLKKEVGMSFTEIVQSHRISRAKYLIKESPYSLEEIANTVGYKSVSFFFRIFKRITGMSPRTYAKTLGDPEKKN